MTSFAARADVSVTDFVDDPEQAAVLRFLASWVSGDEVGARQHVDDHASGDGTTLVARVGEEVVGIVTIRWTSRNPDFAARRIPLVHQISVAPAHRRAGIASRLMDEAESLVRARGRTAVGITVGLCKEYGPAQRLYVSRGYLPDGRGACRGQVPLQPGEEVTIGHDVILWLTKDIDPAADRRAGAVTATERVSGGDSAWSRGMPAEGITTIGDELLRREATPVTGVNADIERLVTSLTKRLRSLGGAGLAAPQVGVPLAVAVIEVRRTELFPDRPESPLFSLVSPRVTAYADTEEEDWEGCFSIPDLVGRVRRPTSVTVQHLSGDGSTVESTYDGYLARVVQHEIDHLAGVLYVDRLTSARSLCTLDHYRRKLALPR